MSATLSIDTQHVARDLGLRLEQVEATLALLDAGNTVPFITRYRKDHTGGLDELQIRQIQQRADSLRLLLERKQTILRSIESQGKLTPELAAEIEAAQSTKRLDDLYLPFKPKKQTLATTARERGLELLAEEILAGTKAGADLDARAADFANPDKGVGTAAEALLGAGHIIAEQYSEHADLRSRLRKIMRKSGRLVSKKIESEANKSVEERAAEEKSAEEKKQKEGVVAENATTPSTDSSVEANAAPVDEAAAVDSHAAANYAAADESASEEHIAEEDAAGEIAASPATAEPEQTSVESASTAEAAASEVVASDVVGSDVVAGAEPVAVPASKPAPNPTQRAAKKVTKKPPKTKKDEKRERLLKALSDYFDFQEDIKRIPAHRVLAINRGERAKALRVKVDSDVAAMEQAADELMIPKDHPNADLLRGCLRDALHRLILPSLEREIRRELTDNAEEHAVDVFARNLRHLLLQPPIHGYRVLAVDPGFRSGCKLAALDEFGGLIDHGIMHIVGKDKDGTLAQAKAKMAEMVKQHNLSVVAIGNGTACRETERLVAELIAELKAAETELAYVIVNEAGASVYSTSSLGRDEFPQYDATLRGAISIGRRLLDPLSELVKIEPANIGVGLYQHDVKAKHLRESLDAVVESCVNYVGVDLNTASPALLRYVSGLNQLTAQRVYEHRAQHGPFKSREQLMEVAGFGEATFVQAAGFLKIGGGENPFDATWIHPESYDTARSVLEKVEASVEELSNKDSTAALAQKTAAIDVNGLSAELGVGNHLLRDIIAQLVRPGRDPREELPKPVFKHGVLKIEDLTAGMELSGTVLNVVDFGAFVDIGLHDSGLVHVSQMANRFIRDPHEVVAVGDVVKVWVATIDKDRRRVGLSMLAPGTEREHPPRPQGRRDGQNRRGGQGGGGQGGGEGQSNAGAAQAAGQQGAAQATQGAGQGYRGGGGRQGGQGQSGQRQGGQGNQRQGGGRRGGPGGASGNERRRFNQPHQQPKPKPKPLVPLTKAMEDGKEPLRTFGDLMQFYQKKKDDGTEEEKK